MANRKTQDHQHAAQNLAFEKGLPADLQAERYTLGAVLVNEANWEKVSAIVTEDDYSLEAHRRIFVRMRALSDSGVTIDRVTLAGGLMDTRQLESVGGLTALSELTQGMPDIVNVEAYARRIKEKSKLRALLFSAQRTIDKAFSGLDSPEEIASNAMESLTPIQSGYEDKEDGRTPEKIVEAFPGGIGAFLDPTLRKRGLPTGFRRLDEMLGGGLQDGELIILAARPSVGKSACALNICQHVTMHPRNPVRADFFSLEMSGESMITRMICARGRVDQNKFRAGYLNRDERGALQRALAAVVESPLRIHDEFKKNLPALVRRIRHAHKNGSRLIAIDYIQLMVTGGKTENRNLEIGEIGRTLKLLTLELKMPILVLSQIGRSAEKRGGDMRPQMSDLKDSGTIEEHADTILTLYREEIYRKDREDIKGQADLEIIKQRNGPLGKVPLRFIGAFTSFENRVEDTGFPEEEQDAPPPQQHFSEPQEDRW